MCFVLPFALLMGRKAKMNPMFLRTVTFLIFAGLWLEKHLMVAPSIRDHDTPTIGATEFFVTGGEIECEFVSRDCNISFGEDKTWILPSREGDHTIYAVVRDMLGGTNWEARTVRIQ